LSGQALVELYQELVKPVFLTGTPEEIEQYAGSDTEKLGSSIQNRITT
jgi:hypothetical protein